MSAPTPHPRPLRRSRTDRMIAGVCAGLAHHFALDVTLVRALYVIVSILSVAFPGILVYVILWIVIPEEGA
jgi:phage shock protein PspC (stress-responsive transcriptional regulator)